MQLYVLCRYIYILYIYILYYILYIIYTVGFLEVSASLCQVTHIWLGFQMQLICITVYFINISIAIDSLWLSFSFFASVLVGQKRQVLALFNEVVRRW